MEFDVMAYKLMPTMIFVPMSTEDLQALQHKVNKWLTVKFPKSDKLFVYKGHSCSEYGYDKIPLFDRDTCLPVVTTVKKLLVELTYRTYQLRRLQDDADYKLALAIFEQYFNAPLDSDEGRFAYLLGLVIQDYEAEHHPIAQTSTVEFIDYLLEARQLQWQDLRTVLGYTHAVSTDFLRLLLQPENIRIQDIVALSHFFRLPTNAFIVGGYNA